MREYLKGKKTYVTGALTILGTALAYYTGDLTAAQALGAIFLTLQQIFVRAGITTEIRRATEVE